MTDARVLACRGFKGIACRFVCSGFSASLKTMVYLIGTFNKSGDPTPIYYDPYYGDTQKGYP